MKTYLLLAPLLGLAACAAATATTPREGPVRLGQTAYVGGPSVRPLKIVEDSRCPANARCIWAGRVVVRADVRGGKWRKQLDLTLGKPQQVADGTLTLVSVTPEKYTNSKLRPANYRFAFAFAGGL